MLLRYIGDQPVTIPSLGLDLAPGGTFEADEAVASELVERGDFGVTSAAPSTVGSVAEVLATVGSDPGAARAALAVEQASKSPRSTLVARLIQILEEG